MSEENNEKKLHSDCECYRRNRASASEEEKGICVKKAKGDVRFLRIDPTDSACNRFKKRVKLADDVLIKSVREYLCEHYPSSCTTSDIRKHLEIKHGLRFPNTHHQNGRVVRFLRKYENIDWECVDENIPLRWRFK